MTNLLPGISSSNACKLCFSLIFLFYQDSDDADEVGKVLTPFSENPYSLKYVQSMDELIHDLNFFMQISICFI